MEAAEVDRVHARAPQMRAPDPRSAVVRPDDKAAPAVGYDAQRERAPRPRHPRRTQTENTSGRRTGMTAGRDAIVIGSGHNGLVAAAYLARAGLSVEVLERNAVAGGAVASEELTQPGFLHDTFSAWHPLFKLSAAHAELGAA